MGESKLALGLVLFTVLVSSALAQGRRPEEAFQQCQQKCQSQSQYGRGQMGQYECQMRCVRELEKETGRGDHYGGRGDRDIDIDVNQFPGIDSQCMDQCRGQAPWQMTECLVRCALQQRQRGQRGQQRDNKKWGPEQGGSSSGRGDYGEDYERYSECLQKCSHQQGRQGEYQQQQCMSQCLQRHQQGRQGAMETNESRRPYGGQGSYEKFGQCVARCSEQHGSQQSECLLRCQQQQDNQEWDPEHGGQGYGRYGECMQRCSRQPGQQRQYCIKRCQKQQGYYPGQQQDNLEWDYDSQGHRGGQSYGRYGECMQRCSRQPGQQQQYCIRQCQQKQQGYYPGQGQDNLEWDYDSQGHRGGQGYETYGECMQRCSRQPGHQKQYCTKKCQQQQEKGYYPGQTSLDNHHKSKKSDSKHKEYSYECIQRCEKRGEDPDQCQKICIQGKGRHGGDQGRGPVSKPTGLASILKFTAAGLLN